MNLPPGFTLDKEPALSTAQPEALPSGFTLDAPSNNLPAGFVLDAPPAAPLPDADSGFFRQVLDVPTQLAKGAVTGTRFLTDVFGADNPVSQTLSGVEDELDSLLSAQSKRDQQEVARIMQQAEDKGVGEQVKAALQALSVAPVDLISNAFGTSAPVILGGLLGTVVGAPAAATATGLGVLTGVGITKDAAYDAVFQELVGSGVPEDQAKEAAKEAQAYSGENLDNIAFGGFLGGLASRFGLEKSIFSGMVRRKLAKEAPEEVIEEALDSAPRALIEASERSTLGEVSRAAVTEAIPEALQGGQEQFTRNVALQREGFDVPTGRGVVTAGTLEGAVGAPVGAIAEGAQRFKLLGDQKAKIDYLNELADNLNPIVPPSKSTPEEGDALVGKADLTQAEINEAVTVAGDSKTVGEVVAVQNADPKARAAILAEQGVTEEQHEARVASVVKAQSTIDRAKQQNLGEFEIKRMMRAPGAPPAPETGFVDIQKTNNETPLSRSFLGRISALQKNRKNLKGAPRKAVSYFMSGANNTADPSAGLFNLAYETATSQATTNADIDVRRTEQPNIPAAEQIQKAAGAPLRTDIQQEEVDAAAIFLKDIADPETVARFDSLVDSIKQRHQDGIIEQARSIRAAETEAGVEAEAKTDLAALEAELADLAPDEALTAYNLAALENAEADEAATGKRKPKPRTRVLSPVSIYNVSDSTTTSAPDPKVQAVENVKAEMGVTRLPRKGTKKRAEYDSKVQAETQRLAKQVETDFENITSEDIAAQIEAQGITAPEVETKYKGADINPDVVVIAESGNLNRTIERLLETLPKELRPIVRQMRRAASATKIEIGPVEGPRPGKYDSGTNTITLDPDGGLTTGVFFHELSHAALARRLKRPQLC